MDIASYFRPLERSPFESEEEQKNILGNKIIKNLEGSPFPEYANYQLAIIGVGEDRGSVRNDGCADAPDRVREKLYALKTTTHPYRIVDLGNLIPGAELQDTYAALTTIMVELLRNGVFVIILGGSQDLTYAQYVAYQKLEETINIVAVDSKFDLGATDEPISSESFLGKIVLHEPNFLFNFSNIGYQTYFVGTDQVELMDKLYFDSYRLGQVHKDIEEAEPIVRNADVLSFDMSSIRQSDAPGTGNSTPNGLYGEEACQIVRYAGMSDKLSSFGLYEINPLFDNHDQTSHLAAQMIWYLIDGYYNRKKDVPLKSKTGFTKFHVALKNNGHEIAFYKSTRSERWWMEVPYPNAKSRYHRHHLVPCSYKDYETACSNELPERWWAAFQKLS
ncbi:MAG TPA: formimidoylglutamase [Bacteroidia bacterium]|nr:formimidoylglutamase [Bacteroidia bacterium]HNS12922.1 formimidoylglutamase [Bacteroidia bacterium]